MVLIFGEEGGDVEFVGKRGFFARFEWFGKKRCEGSVFCAFFEHDTDDGEFTTLILMDEVHFHREVFAEDSVFARRVEVELLQGKFFTAQFQGFDSVAGGSLDGVAVVFYGVGERRIGCFHAVVAFGVSRGKINRGLVFTQFAGDECRAEFAPMSGVVLAGVGPVGLPFASEDGEGYGAERSERGVSQLHDETSWLS